MTAVTRADYERRLWMAVNWLNTVNAARVNLSEQKSDEFQQRYQALADEAHAAYPDITSRCLEFGPDGQLRLSRSLRSV